jgi:hypothetical protein
MVKEAETPEGYQREQTINEKNEGSNKTFVGTREESNEQFLREKVAGSKYYCVFKRIT